MRTKRGSTRSPSSRSWRFHSRRLDEEYAAELAALQQREALGDQSLADKQRIDDMIIEATRRRDDETTALTRSALQEQERDYQSFANSVEQALSIRNCADCSRERRTGTPRSRARSTTC